MAEFEKFSMSAPFDRLLNEFEIVQNGDGRLMMIHDKCQEDVSYVEGGDVMNVLVQVVINHNCTE